VDKTNESVIERRKPKVITFNEISLIQLGNEKLYNLDYLKITQGINEHARIFMRFTNIDAADKEKYLKLADSGVPIVVQYGDKQTLFNGVMTHLGVKLKEANWNLEVRGASRSIELDAMVRSRSFIKRKLTYEELFEQIRGNCKGAMFSYLIDVQTNIGELILQYQETDWNFLKRMAGRFSTGLVACVLYDKPAVTFGVYDENRKTTRIVTDQNNVINKIAKNTYDDYFTDEDDTIMHYKLTTGQFLDIGDPVSIDSPLPMGQESMETNSNLLYVIRSTGIVTKGSDLIWKYVLTPKEGLIQKPYSRRRIAGMSLEGVVKDRIRDTALVELVIDKACGGNAKEQYALKDPNDEATNLTELVYFKCGTPYSAEQNTGFYCMPEIGDSVKIYFPTEDETDGFILQSIRKQDNRNNNLKISKPNVKYFRTRYGKEIKFDQNELVITVQKYDPEKREVVNRDVVVLKLNDENGVILTTQQKITIRAENDVTIDSKNGNVNIAAGDNAQLAMKCGDSSVNMKGGNITIKGKKIKTN
jgi:phage baseplate assembly protein gpV